MKLIKPLFALLIIAAFASCNTPNRPKIHDTAVGTPTNADTVVFRTQMHGGDSLSQKHPLPHVYSR